MIEIYLPIPPSVNASTANRASGKGRGRVKTQAYTRWCSDAGWLLKATKKRLPDKKPYTLEAWMPLDRRSDLDNRCKAILDALVRAGITPDDRWCDHISLHRSDVYGPEARIVVEAV